MVFLMVLDATTIGTIIALISVVGVIGSWIWYASKMASKIVQNTDIVKENQVTLKLYKESQEKVLEKIGEQHIRAIDEVKRQSQNEIIELKEGYTRDLQLMDNKIIYVRDSFNGHIDNAPKVYTTLATLSANVEAIKDMQEREHEESGRRFASIENKLNKMNGQH